MLFIYAQSVSATPVSATILYLGCFADTSNRALPHGPLPGGASYTVTSCSSACDEYQLFSLQNGGQCFCGDSENDAKQYGTSSGCSADRTGGIWANDLFRHRTANGCVNEYERSLEDVGTSLSAGDMLYRDQAIISENRKYATYFDEDGALKLVNLCSGTVTMETPTSNSKAKLTGFFAFQDDGNLVVCIQSVFRTRTELCFQKGVRG